MNQDHIALPRVPGWLRATLLLVLLGGCGGGVDSGGTGGAAVYASGPVNGFGSIVVNGVHFDDTSPALSILDDDGIAATVADLKLGVVVEMRGSPIRVDNFGDSNSTAGSIVVGSDIAGPFVADPNNSSSFTILGRPVDVQPATTFFADSGGLPSSGDVEVHGLYNPLTDRFTATRIERKSNLSRYKIQGRVANFNSTTFTIGTGPNTQTIDYHLVPSGQRPANLGNGMIVRVDLDATPPGSPWIATRVRSAQASPGDGQESKIEGLVDTFTPPGQFSVAGVSVSAAAPTIDESKATLAAGARVKVEGTFANGTLIAQKVTVELASGDDFDFRGLIQAVGANTLTIQGVSIDTSDPNLQFDNGTAGELVQGANVRVRAVLSANGTLLRAKRIQIRH